jgi:hypothetical protein
MGWDGMGWHLHFCGMGFMDIVFSIGDVIVHRVGTRFKSRSRLIPRIE